MRIGLDPRTRRLLRRLPPTNIYSLAEVALIGLLAVQCARLFWTVLTPVGSVGEWQASVPAAPVAAASPELLATFDPFFRLAGDTAPVAVTSLDLKLFGVREDRASGRGSAIIGIPEGQQRSFVVGEEIMPGVVLVGVGFDHVTITRSGAREQVFIDQSAPAEVVTPQSPPQSPPPAIPTAAPPAPAPAAPTPQPAAEASPQNGNAQ